MSNQVYWLLELEVNAGMSDSAKDLMHEMVEAVKANEPGTLNYEWNMNSDQSAVHIYERYADSAAMMVHLGNFGAHYAEQFMGCFSPTGFNIYGSPSEEVKSALSGFGPTYFTSAAGFVREE